MKGSTRRTLGIGVLVFVVLLGVGFWPRHVLVSRGDPTADVAAAQEWTASADCSLLLGEYRVETYRKPDSAFLPEGAVCGTSTGARTALLVALVLTLTVTLVLLVWTYVSIPDEDLADDDGLVDDEPS